MGMMQEAGELLTHMTPAEKAQVLQWVAQDLGSAAPGVETNREVNGGDACIVRTRIPVWLLVQARQMGTTEAELLRSYPSLNAQDLVNAWSYYRSHREEIDQQVADHESA